jgi:hypothetical protein
MIEMVKIPEGMDVRENRLATIELDLKRNQAFVWMCINPSARAMAVKRRRYFSRRK